MLIFSKLSALHRNIEEAGGARFIITGTPCFSCVAEGHGSGSGGQGHCLREAQGRSRVRKIGAGCQAGSLQHGPLVIQQKYLEVKENNVIETKAEPVCEFHITGNIQLVGFL